MPGSAPGVDGGPRHPGIAGSPEMCYLVTSLFPSPVEAQGYGRKGTQALLLALADLSRVDGPNVPAERPTHARLVVTQNVYGLESAKPDLQSTFKKSGGDPAAG